MLDLGEQVRSFLGEGIQVRELPETKHHDVSDEIQKNITTLPQEDKATYDLPQVSIPFVVKQDGRDSISMTHIPAGKKYTLQGWLAFYSQNVSWFHNVK